MPQPHNKLKHLIKRVPGSRQAKNGLKLVKNASLYNQLWVPPGHYYSTIPDEKTISQRLTSITDISMDTLPGINLNIRQQKALFNHLSKYFADMDFTPHFNNKNRYFYENDMYAYGDAAILYGMLRHFKPKRMIEVGSGYTTALMLDTKDAHLPKLKLTCIEPYPDRLFNQLKPQDTKSFTLLKTGLEDVDLKLFDSLAENDILFIDSSHVSKLTSDVNYYMFNILPRLKPGVLIHIHDIRWPFEYPIEVIQEKRYWNESYVLRAFLQFNSQFNIVIWPSYLQARHPHLINKFDLFTHDQFGPGANIWLRRTSLDQTVPETSARMK